MDEIGLSVKTTQATTFTECPGLRCLRVASGDRGPGDLPVVADL